LIVGEVGLAGEVRAVSQAEVRVREAQKMGFRRCILPGSIRRQMNGDGNGIELVGVQSLEELWSMLF
jgi:DNA repair protein RadA/Sms